MTGPFAGWICSLAAAALLACACSRESKSADPRHTDTPILPGLPWHVHDPARPHPKTVTPVQTAGEPPSDAVVLFDGKDLSKWVQTVDGREVPPRCKIGDGWFEVVKGTGNIRTREKFGDCRLHVEWASPEVVSGAGQDRGNSGVFLMGLYEIQVLDAWDNPTYADGQAGAIYGQWPPLVNPARRPGEWNTYDIIFEAPRFEGGKLARPAYVTVIWNGVVVHSHREIMGGTVDRQVPHYTPHAAELPLELQDHKDPVRFRNVWIRRIGPSE